MTVLEGAALSVVLLLALYGASQAVERLWERALRPHRQRLCLLLRLGAEDEDAERQIRRGQLLCGRLCVGGEPPTFAVLDRGMSAQMRQISERLLADGGGSFWEEAKERMPDSCKAAKNSV